MLGARTAHDHKQLERLGLRRVPRLGITSIRWRACRSQSGLREAELIMTSRGTVQTSAAPRGAMESPHHLPGEPYRALLLRVRAPGTQMMGRPRTFICHPEPG